MPEHLMNFNVHRNVQLTGGKLKCDYVLPPRLKNGDTLLLQVTWEHLPTDIHAPSCMFGYVMIAAVMAPDVEHPQAAASPFHVDGRPICFKDLGRVGPNEQNGNVYQFPPLVYGGGTLGRFELTFVCETPNETMPHTTSGLQWSEDPEFDTEG